MKLRRMGYTTTDADGRKTKEKSAKWYAVFQDFNGVLRRLALDEDRNTAEEYANKIEKLNKIRGSGNEMSKELAEFVETMPPRIKDRLVAFNILDTGKVYADKPLSEHVSSWETAKRAKGNAESSIVPVVARVRRIIAACGLVTWKDLKAPGAAGKIKAWVADLRAKKEINGSTFNKYIGDIKDLCRWMVDEGFAPIMALEKLHSVDNTAVDVDRRRALSIDEMHRLVDTAAAGEKHHELTGDERAILYRFAFETGMRPGQIRTLTVANFRLADNPPTVRTQAKFVKRRKVHEQVLRPDLAADLQRRLAAKLPTAPAFRLPEKHRLAEMLRDDLAAARQAWINGAATDPERIDRAKGDFLADVNQDGERAVFYSMRHGHGTALADAGVPEKDIAKSMHHASRTTTARYMHSDRQRVSKAIDRLPDLSYTLPMMATGTDGNSLAPNLSPGPDFSRPDASSCDQLAGMVEDSESLGNIRRNAESSDDPASSGQIAQLVEQWTENPCVAGSIPALPIIEIA
jgi:integrase